MKIPSRLTIPVLAALAAGAVIGLYLTRTSPGARQARSSVPADERALKAAEQPLDTAHELAPLAQGESEQKFAADALRLADHQLDLAFNSAVRTASDQAPRQTQAIRAIQERIARGQSKIAAGNDRIAQLKAEADKASGDRQAALAQQVELTQAEVSFHQDELADAQQDLIRAGGDERSRVQELLDQHNAAEASNQAARPAAAGTAVQSTAANIVAQTSAWSALRAKEQQIATAQAEALALAAALASDHVALDQQVDRERPRDQRADSVPSQSRGAKARRLRNPRRKMAPPRISNRCTSSPLMRRAWRSSTGASRICRNWPRLTGNGTRWWKFKPAWRCTA